MKARAVRSGVVLLLAAFGVTAAQALDLPAPDADGKLVFDVASGQYVATDDAVCTQLVFSADNISVDLSSGGGKEISIPSSVAAKTEAVYFSEDNLSAKILGGSVDFGTSAKLDIGFSGGNRGGRLTFDGTAATIGDIVVGNGKRDCSLILTNKATLAATSLRIASSSGRACTFGIFDGATASFTGNFVPEEGQIGAAGGNLLWIDGLGSSLSVPNKPVLLGRGRSDDRMVVSGQAAVSVKSLQIGGTFTKDEKTDYAKDTVLTVDNATITTTEHLMIGGSSIGSTGLVNKATLTVGTDVTVGKNETASDNYLSVSGSVVNASGGTISVGADGSSWNRAEFRDATISAKSLSVGCGATATNNTLVLAGDTELTLSREKSDYPYFFGGAGNCEVVLEDGFQYARENIGYVMTTTSNSVLRVRTGAFVKENSGSWELGYNGAANTYSVEAGGTTDVYRVYLAGDRNRIVVSNGYFHAQRKNVTSDGATYIGGTSQAGVPIVGCELVLRGTRPEYSSVGETVICGDGKGVLRFELPAAALETLPMSCGIITVNEGAAIHVACADYLKYLGAGSGSVVLARASTAARLVVPQSVLDATNAELPERCKLVKDGKDLVLQVKRARQGVAVIVR